jgi:hypothetical protein
LDIRESDECLSAAAHINSAWDLICASPVIAEATFASAIAATLLTMAELAIQVLTDLPAQTSVKVRDRSQHSEPFLNANRCRPLLQVTPSCLVSVF